MTAADQYRVKALGFFAKAETENNPEIRTEFKNLGRAYSRLAEQAERNAQLDVTYEPPPPKLDDPEVKQ
jgi:hypothetical protein